MFNIKSEEAFFIVDAFAGWHLKQMYVYNIYTYAHMHAPTPTHYILKIGVFKTCLFETQWIWWK